MKNNRRLGLGLWLELELFSLILNLPPMTCDVTCSKRYSDGQNMRRKCELNNVLSSLNE